MSSSFSHTWASVARPSKRKMALEPDDSFAPFSLVRYHQSLLSKSFGDP